MAKGQDKLETFIYELYADVEFFSPYVLQLLDRYFGYKHCTFFPRYSFGHAFPLGRQYAQTTFVETVSLGMSREALRRYYAGPYKDSLFLPENMPPELYEKPVLLVEDIMPVAEYRKTPLFTEPLRNGLCLQMLLQLNADGMQLGSITVLRRLGEPDFNEDDRRLAQRICPHITRAYKANVDKAKMRAQLAFADQFHMDLPHGSIILDNTFSILRYNKAAQDFCADIQARYRQENREQERPHVIMRGDEAMADVQEFVMQNRERLWAVLDKQTGLPAAGQQRRYTSTIKSLSTQDATGRLNVHYVISMAARQAAQLDTAACQRYGLTNREIQVAQHLIQGLTNKQIGEQMYISAHTTKTHITNIFAKTGTAKRAELIYKLGQAQQEP